MTPSDGKPMVENIRPDTFERKTEMATPKKPPPGCVERVLNMRDRNFIIGACRTYCEKGHAKFKDHQKLDRLKKILVLEETIDYMTMIEDALDEERRKWLGARNLYRLWLNAKSGISSFLDLKAQHPTLDREPEKPSARAPEASKEALRGPERTFYLPSKLDAFVEDALQKMDWTADQSEGAVELCTKYGIDGDVVEKNEEEAGA